jgi:hypothetical protein
LHLARFPPIMDGYGSSAGASLSETTGGRDRPRVRAAGKAWVQQGSTRAEFAIRDLSTSGARLIGVTRLPEGERVQVELGLENEVVAVQADVVRVDPQRAEVAVAFRSVPARASELIARAIQTLVERVREAAPPSVLVIHPDSETRAALERDLTHLDRSATLCSTPLEAMWSVDNLSVNHVAAIIGTVLAERANELVMHFSDHHPRVRRILLFGDQLGAVDRAISSRVDAVLRTPWRIRALSRALGMDLADSSIALLPTEPGE